jgi:hypothetical protein
MPAFARTRVSKPPMLANHRQCAVPFSRLTLTAQLEVLAHPAREAWAACLPLNPFLETWRLRATAETLRVTPWPRAAQRWLGGEAYARKLFAALASKSHSRQPVFSSVKVQSDFIASKLDAGNLYPLLWSKNA